MGAAGDVGMIGRPMFVDRIEAWQHEKRSPRKNETRVEKTDRQETDKEKSRCEEEASPDSTGQGFTISPSRRYWDGE